MWTKQTQSILEFSKIPVFIDILNVCESINEIILGFDAFEIRNTLKYCCKYEN